MVADLTAPDLGGSSDPLRAEASMAAISSPAISAGEAVRAPPAPAGRGLQRTLGGLDDQELLGIIGSLERTSQSRAAACELLIASDLIPLKLAAAPRTG
jgi:hypothetical protein